MFPVVLLGASLALSLGVSAVDGNCLCLTTGVTHIRASPCGEVLRTARSGACYKAMAGEAVCELDGKSYKWREIDFGGQTAWIADTFLETKHDGKCSACSNLNLISRAGWGARPPSGTTPLNKPLPMVFIHHSAGSPCFTQADCISQVQGIQDFHMDGNGWSDIGYNFLVGEDGNGYEGRGWDNQGAHASGWNDVSYGICIIGTFETGVPNAAAQNAAQDIIDCGLISGDISGSYSLHGHRDGVATACPGDALYDLISGWPNFGGPL